MSGSRVLKLFWSGQNRISDIVSRANHFDWILDFLQQNVETVRRVFLVKIDEKIAKRSTKCCRVFLIRQMFEPKNLRRFLDP